MVRRTAALLAAAACLGLPGAAAAQGRGVTISGPAGNPLRVATPRFDVTTTGFVAADLPVTIEVQVALTPDFAAPLWADTTVTGSSATIVIPRLLPPSVDIYWRAIARTAQGTPVISNAFGPRRTLPWVQLIFPNGLNGTTVNTPRPIFQWTAQALLPPVANWKYTIFIYRTAGQVPVFTGTLSDTLYSPPADLEFNTSYSWTLSAVAGTGDSIHVASSSTFVIVSPNAPLTTLLYAPFPNPFPNDRLGSTCIWFDLQTTSNVTLDVLDLRGTRVRRLLPRADLGANLGAGRFGRATFGSDSGCDSRFTWDGTDDAGRNVPPGVYLIRLTANGRQFIQKTLFKGR